MVTNAINSKGHFLVFGPWLIQQVKFWLNRYWEVRIIHVHSKANCFAHAKEKLSMNHDYGLRFYDDCLVEVLSLLLHDVFMINTPRIISI